MEKGNNHIKTSFALTILFSLILNGIRAETNDEIKSQIQDQYSKSNISYIFSDVINKLPTLKNQVFGIEYLFELMRENNDVNNTEKIFEYARQKNQFHVQNLEEMKASDLYVDVTLPECVDTVIRKSKHICFDNGNYILKTYSNPFYPNTPYYLYKGNCVTAVPELNFHWRVISGKQNNVEDLKSLDQLSTMENVKFELAPDGERCYVQVNGKYLTKDGKTEYLTLKNDKSPNGIWYVRSRVIPYTEEF